jgi:chaperone modulatory protein CbpM
MKAYRETLLALVEGVEESELEVILAEGWITPAQEGGRDVFQDIDIARLRLIRDLRRDMGVNDEAVPVILNLVDQVNQLRAEIDAIGAALSEQPEATRAAILKAIARHAGG